MTFSRFFYPGPTLERFVFIPRIIITGLNGGTGKTTLSLGITRALARRGLAVQPFKKGPDYVDTAWLGRAAGREARNLDPYWLDEAAMLDHFQGSVHGADIAVIEGNRGFFDGLDIHGSTSTAEVARRLASPVLLAVNCTKMTRTTAALVSGCRNFPGGEPIRAVLLNQVRGPRHADLAREAVEKLADTPVVGTLPRLKVPPILENRDGLVPVDTCPEAEAALDTLADLVEVHVDLDLVLDIARSAAPLALSKASLPAERGQTKRCRIGYVHDQVLWQYYPENLEALRKAGAELVRLRLDDPEEWPKVDGLYLGGGSLRGHHHLLNENAHLVRIAAWSGQGMPIYAEHAGFMLLAEAFADGQSHIRLAGVYPGRMIHSDTPQGLGYVEVRVEQAALYLPVGTTVRAHEYHYVRYERADALHGSLVRTKGIDLGRERDGYGCGRTFGTFMQIYAPAAPGWGEGLVEAVKEFAAGD